MRQREYNELTVIKLERGVNDIDFGTVKACILKMPSEIIYFTVNGCFWGCISTGDIIRSKGKITINRNCIKLDRWNSIQARNIFEKRNNIHKIPVVNHGVLEGGLFKMG